MRLKKLKKAMRRRIKRRHCCTPCFTDNLLSTMEKVFAGHYVFDSYKLLVSEEEPISEYYNRRVNLFLNSRTEGNK